MIMEPMAHSLFYYTVRVLNMTFFWTWTLGDEPPDERMGMI